MIPYEVFMRDHTLRTTIGFALQIFSGITEPVGVRGLEALGIMIYHQKLALKYASLPLVQKPRKMSRLEYGQP